MAATHHVLHAGYARVELADLIVPGHGEPFRTGRSRSG